MSHMRQQALLAIKTATTGLATTGANVFLARVSPLQRTELPAGIIFSGRETIDPETFPRPRFQERTFQVDWVVFTRETDDFETELNQIMQEVEVALANPTVASSFGAKAITLRNIDAPQRVQNEQTYVQASMNFEVRYMTLENAPDVAK